MRSKLFVVLAACACSLVLAATASAADSVYWVNLEGSPLSRAGLGGGGAEVEVTPEEIPITVGAAIDAAAGKIYWIGPLSSQVNVANLDGSEQGSLATAGAPVETSSAMAIDPVTRRLYWINNTSSGSTLSYADLDGSGGGLIPTDSADFDTPSGAVIDPSLGRIYWANASNSTIGWANLDGTGSGMLSIAAPNTPKSPTGVAIDAAQGRIYWTNSGSGGSIGYANLDGTGGGVLAHAGAPISEPFGLAINPASGSVYWANRGAESIAVASLAGTGGSTLDVTGAPITLPESPMLLVAPEPAAVAEPASLPLVKPGETMACRSGVWAGDLTESQLYRAPQTVAYSWSRDGVAVPGATGATLVAGEPGTYTCLETATNFAGSTTAAAGTFGVEAPSQQAPPSNPPAGGGPGSPAPPLSPRPGLSLAKAKLDPAHGTATISAKVSGRGTVTLTGAGLAPDNVKIGGAGTVKLKVAATGRARKALRRAGTAKVKATVKFVAAAGGSVSRSQAITLRLKARG